MDQTLCRQFDASTSCDNTEIKWHVRTGDLTNMPRALPKGHLKEVLNLLQINKIHVDWLGKLRFSFRHLHNGIDLVQRSTALTALFVLNLDPPPQSPRENLPREAEECNPPVVGAHFLFPLLKKGTSHPSLPLQRHQYVANCQQNSLTTKSKALRNLG